MKNITAKYSDAKITSRAEIKWINLDHRGGKWV